MAEGYLTAAGDLINSADFVLPKAQELAAFLTTGRHPYAWPVEYRRVPDTGAEVVVFDVEVELPQRKVHDIRREERIAALFGKEDNTIPETLALRPSFPLVPHLNLRDQEFPRSLCLYDEPYSELRRHWTAARFVERIRHWLALTARGQLHGDDQPLEPLLLVSTIPLVLPAKLFSNGNAETPDWLSIYRVDGANQRMVLIADSIDKGADKAEDTRFVATTLQGVKQPHGIIRRVPSTLQDLHTFLAEAEIDLLTTLRQRLRSWDRATDLLDAKLILVIDLPKTRVVGGAVEVHERWGFLCTKSIGELGEQIGLWEIKEGNPGFLILVDHTRQGDGVEIVPLLPMDAFSPELGAKLNGIERDDRRITAIGLGALGSQVFDNLQREGFGEWTLIDYDYFLPHNLAHHALSGLFVGRTKADALAFSAFTAARTKPIKAIEADVLASSDFSDEVDAALKAEIILDMSASVAVARHLARDVEISGRVVSLFLNPSGTDLVLLAEDAGRQTTIDALEMQYYRSILHDPALRDHLRRDEGSIRYARSCRDVSRVLSQELVALHAAIGSRAVRNAVAGNGGTIAIWKASTLDLTVEKLSIPTAEMVAWSVGDWTVCSDRWFLETISRRREEKLPNETGGVLIGAFDLQRHIIYVVDTVPSPPDSTEWSTIYIRGYNGLARRIEEIGMTTDGMLEYIGEWHSHPMGYGCQPSHDDRKAFSWLADCVASDGVPAVMLIVADDEQFGWYIGTIP